MELIDFEGVFQEKLLEIYEKNRGKTDPKKLHKLVRKAYAVMADSYYPPVKSTPRVYFASKSDEELASLLARYAASDYAVPELLIAEFSARESDCAAPLLAEGASDKLVRAVALAAGARDAYLPAYLGILVRTEDDDLAELLFDRIAEHPDVCKEQALACLREGKGRERMLDLLSRVREPDEAVFTALLRELKESPDPTDAARYLARYGDARALPALEELLEREDIGFNEFRELRCAYETLGGVYDKERDFSEDPDYLAVLASAIKQSED